MSYSGNTDESGALHGSQPQPQPQPQPRIVRELLVQNEYFRTENACDQDYSSLKTRLTYCYMLSAYALLLGSAPDESLLVHGTIHSAIKNVDRIDHAWLILPDYTIWEPISGNIMTASMWRTWADARVTCFYNKNQAKDYIILYGHWGPWH